MYKKLPLVINLFVAIALFAPLVWLSGGAAPARAQQPVVVPNSATLGACSTMGPHDLGKLDKDIVLLREDKIIVWDPSLGNGCDGANPIIWQTQGTLGPTFVKWVDIATGDFNGDGRSEIVVVGNLPTNANTARSRVVRVYDPFPGLAVDVSLTLSETVPAGSFANSKPVWTHVTTSDVNLDGKDEIITVAGDIRGTTVYVFNVVLGAPPTLELMCSAPLYAFESHAVAAGHMLRTDGVDRGVVAVAEKTRPTRNEGLDIKFVDTVAGGGTCPILKTYRSQYSNHGGDENQYDFVAGDIDGNGFDEMALVADVGTVDPDYPINNYYSLAIFKSVGGGIYTSDSDWYNTNTPGWGKGIEDDAKGWPEHYFTRGHVAMGDLDGIVDAGGVYGKELVAIRNQSGDRVLIKQPLHTSRDSISKIYPGKDPEDPDNSTDTFSGVAVGDFYGWKSMPFERVAMFWQNQVYLFNYNSKYVDPPSPKPRADPKPFVTYSASFGSIRRMVVGAINGPRLEGPETPVTFLKLESGPDPSPRAIPISYASTLPCTYTASISPPVTWLQVTPPIGAAPGNVTLQVTGAITTLGVYTTVVTFSGQMERWPARGTFNVPVTLKVVDSLERGFLPVILARAY